MVNRLEDLLPPRVLFYSALMSLLPLDRVLMDHPELIDEDDSTAAAEGDLPAIHERLSTSRSDLIHPLTLENLSTIDQLKRYQPEIMLTPLLRENEDKDEDHEAKNHEDDEDEFVFPTPIHLLCEYASSPHLIQHCIDMCPAALSIRDADGYRPLDLLCKRDDVPLETIETLEAMNPEERFLRGA
jgi:hypothetical protein